MPDTDNIGVEILVLSSVALISNTGLLTAEALTGKPNDKELTLNEEPSPNNGEVTALDLIPPPNGAVAFNDIDREKFDDTNKVVLMVKTGLESMLDESGFGTTTEMEIFTMDKHPVASLTWTSPRCPLSSHSLVCIKKDSFIVRIGPILNKELEFIF